jgi:hypothetical protein
MAREIEPRVFAQISCHAVGHLMSGQVQRINLLVNSNIFELDRQISQANRRVIPFSVRQVFKGLDM